MSGLLLVLGAAALLGLRHATDPDHLAAVATLTAGGDDRRARVAARLGLVWGLGHASSLVVFGIPIVLFGAYLPDRVQRAAEASVGVLVVALAAWLLVRWRRGAFHFHDHTHLHAHGERRGHGHGHRPSRTPLRAYAIGLVHGTGGSAGVGVLLLAGIHDHALALASLGVFAAGTAASMALLSTGFGVALSLTPVQRGFERCAPLLGVASLAFGVWYFLGALEVAPYFL